MNPTDKAVKARHGKEMKLHEDPIILGADRLQQDLVVGFSDGRSGRYSARLLYAALSAAEELFVDEETPSAKSQPAKQTQCAVAAVGATNP